LCWASPMSTPSSSQNPAWRAIVIGGLLGALGDFVFAFAFYGLKIGVFQSVAGGLIGRETARAGGIPTFMLGVVLHFLIGIIWAALFWLLSRRVPAMTRHAIPAGLIWGLVVFYGMNCVVIPLSALHGKPWPPPWPWIAPWPFAAHAVFVGLPIALVAQWADRRAKVEAALATV